MSAGILDILIDQGATSNTLMDLEQSDGNEFEAIDITGWTFQLQVREKVNSDTVALEASTANGKITITGDPVNGEIAILFTDTETATLKPRVYVYDLKATAPGGVVRVTNGDVVVSAAVTR